MLLIEDQLPANQTLRITFLKRNHVASGFGFPAQNILCRQRIFPLYFAFTAQARESLLRGLSGFFVARITISGGALLQKNAYD